MGAYRLGSSDRHPLQPFLSRVLIWPVHEKLLGRPTFRCGRELEESQWWSPDEIRSLQDEKLGDLLRHARAHIPFYRKRFADAGVDTSSDNSREVLNNLPILEKTEIHRSLETMVWKCAPGGLFRSSTGGSSGEPLTFFMDRRRQAYDQAARIRSHRWFGVGVGQRELYLWGSPIENRRTDRLRRVRDAVFNHRLLSAFEMSPARMDYYLLAWKRFRPVCLFGYPSSIALLCEHIQRRCSRFEAPNLKAIFVTGEVCHSHHRKQIADCFEVPVADGYGSRDAGFLAHECPAGRMHITAENVVVEILRDGSPVRPGESGEIVITQLDNYAMPLIRYRTGDVGRLKPGRCVCGRGLPMMDVVEGRTTDFLHLPDGTTRHALSIIYPLRELSGIRRFCVTQHADYGVTVDVVADDAGERITRDRVVRGVRPVVGPDIRLTVHFVSEIPSTPSGKFRYVVSHVQKKTVAVREESANRA